MKKQVFVTEAVSGHNFPGRFPRRVDATVYEDDIDVQRYRGSAAYLAEELRILKNNGYEIIIGRSKDGKEEPVDSITMDVLKMYNLV